MFSRLAGAISSGTTVDTTRDTQSQTLGQSISNSLTLTNNTQNQPPIIPGPPIPGLEQPNLQVASANVFSQFRLGGSSSSGGSGSQSGSGGAGGGAGGGSGPTGPANTTSMSSFSNQDNNNSSSSQAQSQRQHALMMQQQNLQLAMGNTSIKTTNEKAANKLASPPWTSEAQKVDASEVQGGEANLLERQREEDVATVYDLVDQLASHSMSVIDARENILRKLIGDLDQDRQKTSQLSTILGQQIQKIASASSSIGLINPSIVPNMGKYANIPPFYWVPSSDYIQEFAVQGEHKEIVTKLHDFEDQGWVIPVSGSLRIVKGSIYRWGLRILRKCYHRPQMQFGLHGLSHEKPWRLVTTSRCSRSKDDDPWKDRVGGDRLIDENDEVHIICDMRGIGPGSGLSNPNESPDTGSFGTFGFSINDGPFELVFDDLPLDATLMPVVSMGGDGSSIQLLPY